MFGPRSLTSFEARAYSTVGDERREALVWWAGGRLREESRTDSGELVWLQVNNGSDWWMWDVRRRVARTNTQGDRGGAFPMGGANQFILGQGRLAISPNVEIMGRDEIAGRAVLRIRLPDREVSIDEEFGTALRAVFRGKLLVDVTDIAYAGEIDEARFAMDPVPPDVEVRAASHLYDEAPIAEVAGLVDFPVFAPGSVSLTWPAFDAYRHRGDAQEPEAVYVSLRRRPIWIAHSRSPNPGLPAARTKPEDWRRLSRGGTEFEVCEKPPRVRFVRDGVHLEIYGEGENLEQLLAVALSLEQIHPV